MTLLQAEEGFACLKGALGLRPNFHQLEARGQAHVFISVLAYHLLAWVCEKLRDCGEVRDWKTLRRLLSTHSLATTRLPLADERVLHIRKATAPAAEQSQVYRHLGIEGTGDIYLRWSSVPGRRYAIEQSTGLGTWATVGGFESITASAESCSASVPETTDAAGFFRIRVLP